VKAAHIREIEVAKSLYFAGKLLFKGEFLFGLKTVRSNSLQTSNQAFLAMFTAISQLKNTQVSLSGLQEMCVSSVEKWA